MTFQQLIKHFKSQSNAARKLGVSRQAVNGWKENGIPDGQQAWIQILTSGKLKADERRVTQ